MGHQRHLGLKLGLGGLQLLCLFSSVQHFEDRQYVLTIQFVNCNQQRCPNLQASKGLASCTQQAQTWQPPLATGRRY